MLEFLSATGNLPFVIALAILAGLAAIEAVGLLVGFAFSHVLDSALGIDLDLDLDMDFDAGCHPLALLGFGKVPTFIVITLLVGIFGLAGILVQAITLNLTGALLNVWIAVGLALILSLPLVSVSSRLFGRFLIREETQAVSEDSFVGRVATITLGTSRVNHAAQAKLEDEHGQTHYVMVEPLEADHEFAAGAEVLVVSRKGSAYQVVENSYEALERLSHAPHFSEMENQNNAT
jgi:membrane protein implicated in regulation of membrane protease activity